MKTCCREKDFSIKRCMAHYFEKVEPVPVARSAEPEEPYVDTTPLRSLIMKMAWPARKVLSTIAYGVSVAAQQVTTATVELARTCNKLLATAKAEVAAGRCQQTYRRVDLGRPCIVTFFDASYGQESDGHSQAGFYSLATDESVLTQTTAANPVEHSTNKIKRVVKSTFAAEGSSMSLAIDRHLYARLLFQALMYGESSCHLDDDWRGHLKVSGYLVTDAKSLYDHLHTTGSMPSERSAMLDLLGAKELIDQGIIKLRWCPTQLQFADHLTKTMKSDIISEFILHGQVSLTQTAEQASVEVHKSTLRQGQRQRRKVRMKKTMAAESNAVFYHVSR